MAELGINIARKRMVLEYNSALGLALKRMRTERHIEQEDLAKRLGWVQGSVSKLESGQRSLKVAELTLFASALGLPRDEFVGELLEAMDHQDEARFRAR